jgi:hypothetical protein
MNLISLSIDILWLALGIIILCGIIWVALWGVKQIVAVPQPIERVIWAVVIILILIAILSMLAGGGGLHPFRWFHSGPDHYPALAAAADLQGLLICVS